MASIASEAPPASRSEAGRVNGMASGQVKGGVPPLRAGQGHSFFWRRLHSLSGIFPVGAFLIEHMISNAYATNGISAYNEQVRFLSSLPFVLFLEIFFIYIPLAYHAGYGVYIWWRGDSNVGAAYPWMGNWLYTLQRVTGIIALIYIGYHTYNMRFSGVELLDHTEAAYAKVWLALQNPWVVLAYFVGAFAATWHFAYGIWLFAAKWGFIVGEGGRRKFGYICAALGVAMAAIWAGTLYAFISTPAGQPELMRGLELLRQFS